MLRILIGLPLLLILVLFALSNPRPVQLGLWPTDLTITVPTSVAILFGMAVAFLVGAMLLWFSAVAARLRARRAEHLVRLLNAQVAQLKAECERLHEAARARPAPQPMSTALTLNH